MTEHTQIVEILALEPVDGVGVTDLAKRIGKDKSTTHRRLADLVEAGWCEQTATGNYILSAKFAAIAESIRKGLVARGDMIVRRLSQMDATQAAQ